ncbi:MAG: hypothetical protein QF645_03660 [Planctomycetota bacterium]|nr:hypothetical protein [Planctomycetota bacterium]
MILALDLIRRNNKKMANVTCPECDLRVHPRNGACPSCGTLIQRENEPLPSSEIQQELFSAKSIRRTRMWPATLLVLLGGLSLCGILATLFLRGNPLVPMTPLFWIVFLASLLGMISYLWYVRTTIIIRRNESGETKCYLEDVGGKVRKMELPLQTRHSWSTHPYPILVLGHLLRVPKPVLTLSIEDQEGQILCAFQEEVRTGEPIPEDWPEEERPLPKEVIYDCFPLPRFNLPLLKNTLDQSRPKEDRS